jgi:hypothetical protein
MPPRYLRLCLLLVATLPACTPPLERAARPSEDAPAPPPPVAPPTLEPLAGDWLAELRDEDGKSVGSVAIPLGARERRPFVVAVHGAGSRPDWMCGAARASIGPHPFIVCPHPGEQMTSLASWGTPLVLRRAIDRSVEALLARHRAYVEPQDALYLGHSQGSILAADALALPSNVTFRSAILFEGLPREPARARAALVHANVERLLLVSGQGGWAAGHEAFARSFEGTATRARHVHRPVGHFFNAEVFELVKSEVPWVVEGSGAWR